MGGGAPPIPCSARQSIFLTKEILFDYLIAIVTQKLTNLAQMNCFRHSRSNVNFCLPKNSKENMHIFMKL